MKQFVAAARKAMGPDGRKPDGYAIIGLLEELGRPVPLDAVMEAITEEGQTVALLTRTNLEAFQLAQWCASRAIPHQVRKGAGGAYWPGWIARLTLGYKETALSVPLARRRWERDVGAPSASFNGALAFLQAQGVADRDKIDLAALCRRIRSQTPAEVAHGAKAPQLTISTIHRSKGMEFDRVFVLEPHRNSGGDPEEVRVMYVAATRARVRLRLLARDKKVFTEGGKHRGQLTHFHCYDRKLRANRILLADGLDEIDVTSLLTPWTGPDPADPVEAVRSCQGALWDSWLPGRRTFTANRANNSYFLTMPSGSPGTGNGQLVCRLAQSVCRDLETLGRKFGGSTDSVLGMSEVSVGDLATIALPRDENPCATERLGAACLALAPVVYGQATLDMV
jgi:hypothetical protein